MPFTITRKEPGLNKLYAVLDIDRDVQWDPRKREATPLSELEAEALALEINRFSSVVVEVEGLRVEAVAA